MSASEAAPAHIIQPAGKERFFDGDFVYCQDAHGLWGCKVKGQPLVPFGFIRSAEVPRHIRDQSKSAGVL